jgi:hypothetical protein
MTDDVVEIVRARAANPDTIHDMAQGPSPAPKIYAPAVRVMVLVNDLRVRDGVRNIR